jgi:hypothetical protein
MLNTKNETLVRKRGMFGCILDNRVTDKMIKDGYTLSKTEVRLESQSTCLASMKP